MRRGLGGEAEIVGEGAASQDVLLDVSATPPAGVSFLRGNSKAEFGGVNES